MYLGLTKPTLLKLSKDTDLRPKVIFFSCFLKMALLPHRSVSMTAANYRKRHKQSQIFERLSLTPPERFCFSSSTPMLAGSFPKSWTQKQNATKMAIEKSEENPSGSFWANNYICCLSLEEMYLHIRLTSESLQSWGKFLFWRNFPAKACVFKQSLPSVVSPGLSPHWQQVFDLLRVLVTAGGQLSSWLGTCVFVASRFRRGCLSSCGDTVGRLRVSPLSCAYIHEIWLKCLNYTN